MIKLYRNNNGRFITRWAYEQEAKAGKLALGIFLSIGVIMSLIDSII